MQILDIKIVPHISMYSLHEGDWSLWFTISQDDFNCIKGERGRFFISNVYVNTLYSINKNNNLIYYSLD